MKLLILPQNFNGCTVDIWERISNFNPHFIMDGFYYVSMLGVMLNHVSKRGHAEVKIDPCRSLFTSLLLLPMYFELNTKASTVLVASVWSMLPTNTLIWHKQCTWHLLQRSHVVNVIMNSLDAPISTPAFLENKSCDTLIYFFKQWMEK